MKKIFFSIVALAALAACSKTEVAYEQTADEIGFVAVANTLTKSPVSGDTYPTTLDMYVNAFVNAANVTTTTPDYFENVHFLHKSNNKWGGDPSQYWPNETALKFSGYSISGNIGEDNKGSYNPSTDVLTITGYNPGTDAGEGKNDLMWFPATGEYTKLSGKDGVTAQMYHTCSWITFLVQGDAVTSLAGNEYTITSLEINGVNMVGKVTCAGTAKDDENNSIPLSNANLKEFVKWTQLSNSTAPYEVNVYTDGVSLVGTYTPGTPADGETPEIPESYSPKNIETNANTTTGGNIVVIPQKPGSISLAWTYKSPAGQPVEDSATGLSLKLNDANTLDWEPGKHYVYTITVTASEILIAPTPTEWVDGTSGSVTVQ